MKSFNNWLITLRVKLSNVGAFAGPAKTNSINFGLPLDEQRIIALASQTPSVEESSRAMLLEPFTSASSKDSRNDLLQKTLEAFNEWLNVPGDKLKIIGNFANMIYDLQRVTQSTGNNPESVVGSQGGKAHIITSTSYAILAACQGLSPLQSDMLKLSDSYDIAITELLSLQRGCGLDAIWQDMSRCPTEEEYMSTLEQTGVVRAGIRLMMACATTNRDVDYLPLVSMIWVFLQIREDFMDLQIAESSENESFAKNLSNGKFAFPLVHSIHQDQTDRYISSVVQKRPSTPRLKVYTIEYLKNQTRSFDYTLTILATKEREIREEITRLGGNVRLEELMDYLYVQND